MRSVVIYCVTTVLAVGISICLMALLDFARGINRRHGRYLANLQRQAAADYDFCSALASLTPDDREWLKSTGWREPPHARFVRLNNWAPEGLQVDA